MAGKMGLGERARASREKAGEKVEQPSESVTPASESAQDNTYPWYFGFTGLSIILSVILFFSKKEKARYSLGCGRLRFLRWAYFTG